MKRIATIVLLVGIMYSCLPKTEPDPTLPGAEIYNGAANQQAYATDFFDIAFRFNVLFTEGKTRDMLDAISDIKVLASGEEIGLQYCMFGAGVAITSPDHIIYTISYDPYATLQVRHGKVIINTGGKTLDELTENDTWHITIDNTEPFVYSTNSGNNIKVDNVEMYITAGITPHSWDVAMNGFRSYYSDEVKSDWDLALSITQLDKSTLSYSDLMSSRIRRSGGGSGRAMNNTKMSYTIDAAKPLIMLPSCSLGFISSGAVTVAIDPSETIDETRYPSREVYIEWNSAGNCSMKASITYNGITK